jgi:RNA polymerase sigma-70 factor (ECF subfamily)
MAPVSGSGTGGGSPDLTSTVELIRKVRLGDRAAHDRLASRFLAPLRRWAAGRLPRRARTMIDTDDLVQDTLMRTMQRVDVLDPQKEGGFQSYLRQAVINRIRDEVRRAGARPRGPVPEQEPEAVDPSPLEEVLGAEALARYDAAIVRLRPDDREAVLARVELGLDYGEIAEALGKPSRDAARMAVSRALLRLAKEVARDQ